MRATEIESWALRVVEQVRAGQPNEDSLVELKREPPDDLPRAARQIAALANSAYGETVMWILGVDEKSKKIIDLKGFEISNWWSGIEAQFDEIAPSFQPLAVRLDDQVILALAFGTERIPFVVKNPEGGRIAREVPWRNGNRTDSARRSDLVRLLVPSIKIPDFEVLDAFLQATPFGETKHTISAKLSVYVVPRTTERLVFPYHKMSFAGKQQGSVPWEFSTIFVNAYRRSTGLESSTITESSSEFIVNGPGRFELHGSGTVKGVETGVSIRLSASLSPTSVNSATLLSTKAKFSRMNGSIGEWRMVRDDG